MFSPLLLAFGSGCHGGAAPATSASAMANANGAPSAGNPATPPGANTVIHAEDDGKSFDLARGATVTFSLPSNAGTGYIWVPTQVDPVVLAQQGDRTSDVASDVPGAPKVDVYHFAATGPGTTTVEMSLKRPFGSGAPARTIHVTVAVH
jgi:predicted secreted protein